jgi:formylglycine-generating enzyme required for sulfatase activity
MKNTNTKNLEQLIAKHGQSIIKDKMRCESLIRDYHIGSILERNLLIQSLKIGFPQELLSNQKNPQLELILRRSISNMQNSYGIKDELTNWILETWKKALISPNTQQKKTIPYLENPTELIIDLGKNINLEMVIIPAGKFVMGSPVYEKNRYADEKQNEVTLTKSYCMGKYPVTQEQWEIIMGNNPSDVKGAKLPVTNVSWNYCQDFIKLLNKQTGGGYRLPTESEWEYACRGGTETAYFFGEEIKPKDGNYGDSNIGKPVAVGSYKPNAFGLCDMHGNVCEWCEDWYENYPAGGKDPKGIGKGEHRVLRGGSFAANSSGSRSACRFYLSPSNRSPYYGFRLAKEIQQKKTITALDKPPRILTDSAKDINYELVLIPPGNFKMGSPKSGNGNNMYELQHQVFITKPYRIGKYAVTQEQWEIVMGSKISTSTTGCNFPATNISWNDCQEFINKLNKSSMSQFRLPTEAEWEYACRGGTTSAYSFGDTISPSNANYYESNIGRPVAVGNYLPNSFGLYDMHGNVWEWCEDWYGEYSTAVATNPTGPSFGQSRILRGGAFSYVGLDARSSSRFYFNPTLRYGSAGFRLATDV